MKSIKINKNEITITFDSEEKAQALYDWLHPSFIQKYGNVNGNVFTYKPSKMTYNTIEGLLKKVVYDSDGELTGERYWGAFQTDTYSNRYNCMARGDKIFRVTPVNEDGTLGTLDFGVHQYTNFFSIVLTNNPSEFVFLSDRCHVDRYDGHHQLKFKGYFETGSILIEVAELQF